MPIQRSAALVAGLLLREALAQRLHQRVPAAERLDARLFLLGQGEREAFFQPVGRHLGGEQRLERGLGAPEVRGEDAVEAVEVALVLDQHGAGEEVELFGRGKVFGGDSPLAGRPAKGTVPCDSASSSARNSVTLTGTPAARSIRKKRISMARRARRVSRGGRRAGSGTPAARTGARPARS